MPDLHDENPAAPGSVSEAGRACAQCGADVPREAGFCAACGAARSGAMAQRPDHPFGTVSPFGALGVAGALALIGSALIASAVAVWDGVITGAGGAAPVLAAIVLTLFAVGAIVAEITFARHLRASGAREWYRNTRALIGAIWIMTFLATLVALIEN